MKLYTALAEIRTSVGTLFPDKSELVNPYDVEDNSLPFLRDGYGIGLGLSEETNDATVYTVVDHEILIVLTKEILKTDSNPDPVFNTIRDLKQESLDLRKDLLCANITGISKLVYNGDSAVELVENNKIATITVTFTATVFEAL